MLRHIARRSREETSAALNRTMWDAVMAENGTRKKNAYLHLFMFAHCILRAIPRHRNRTSTSSGNVQSINNIIRDRIAQWNAGETQELWADVQSHAKKMQRHTRSYTTPSAAATERLNLRRASTLAKEGALSKASQTLFSNGIHSTTQEVADKLLEKHPQTTPHTDGQHDMSTQEEFELRPILPLQPVETDEVTDAIRRVPRGSAAGASGLSTTHVRELIQVPGAHDEGGLIHALAALLTELARGAAPRELAEWITGAPITPLRKPNGDVRPIAVGETLRRLVSSILLARFRDEIRDYLTPLQVGVATRCGGETIIHGVRELTRRYGNRPDLAVLQLDLTNAFNLVSRRAIVKQIRKHFPEMMPWVEFCYGASARPQLWLSNNSPQTETQSTNTHATATATPTPTPIPATIQFRSCTGVQQGDPLGPFLFALAIHPIVLKMRARIQNAHNQHNLFEHPALLGFYLDDGIVVAHHAILADTLRFLRSTEVIEYGIHLKSGGTKIWWPSLREISAEHRQLYASMPPSFLQLSTATPRTPQNRDRTNSSSTTATNTATTNNIGNGSDNDNDSENDGINVLGTPIGSPQFTTKAIISRADEINTALQMLARMDDAHIAFTLARSCLGACRLNFLLRTVPTSLAISGAKRFDNHLYDLVKHIAGGILSRNAFDELQLPVRIEDATLPHLGAGLTSATRTAPSAYLASLATVGAAAEQLLIVRDNTLSSRPGESARLLALQTNPNAKDAYDRFKKSTRDTDKPPTLAQIGQEPGRWNQTELSKLSHLHAAARHHARTASTSVTPADRRRLNRYRLAQLIPGAKDWLRCLPSPGLGTYIHHTAFTSWFGYYARAPKQIGGACPRRHCKQQIDKYGDHLLACGSGLHHSLSPRVRRHDQLVRQLAALLQRAHRSPIVEPRCNRVTTTNSRPDIRALGTSGGEDLIDVSVHHVLAPSQVHSFPASLLRDKYERKIEHHAAFAATIPGAIIQPITMCTTGGWHPDSYLYISRLAASIAARTGTSSTECTAITRRQFAAKLITLNARCFLDGVESRNEWHLTPRPPSPLSQQQLRPGTS